jgi:hypothetical protein
MTKPSPQHFGSPSGSIHGVNGPMIDALMHSGEAYAKACLAWQEEVCRFLGSRLQWDGRVTAALAKCRSLTELAEIQQDWARTTAQDYVEEVGRLTQIASSLVPAWLPRAAPRPASPQSRPID